ncbi:MAG: energy-coupling factor ABC transporter ATP-binding protein [Chloroflexaceae bacterium]|jgi:energy-coupling factor transport system ATP-binding protein|nr:energy-coupling factor ABC transporter ATP-binding protein [Chloroflexaceae bacterium]
MSLQLSLEQLTFRYQAGEQPALYDMSLEVAAREMLLIAGGSGSGKSTLLRCVNGLIPRSYKGDLSGRIAIGGDDPAGMGLAQLAQLVGTLLQDPERQIVASFVERQAAFGPENLGWPRQRIREAVDAALERLHITHLRKRETHHLSGGERQKVALAGLLTMNPPTLLLDEPLASLDPASAREALQLFRTLADEGHGVLLVEHRVEDALYARPDRALFMANGTARYMGDIAGFLADADPHEVKLPVEVALPRLAANGAEAARPRATPGDKLLEFEDVHFGYGDGRPILKGVSMTVRQGEVVAILGPNGAGKSTLLRHSIGLLKPKKGRVLVAGQEARKSTTAQLARTVGYVFQSPSHMLFAPSVREELAFGPRNLGRSKAEIDAARPQALANVNLEGFDERAPLALSYGQQKRLSIASVLSMQPRVLVLDEPTAGQDYANTIGLMHTIGKLQGLEATVLITHDVDLAVTYATRVVLMRDGQIEADGPPEQVLANLPLLEKCRVVPSSLLLLNLKLLPRTGRFLGAEALIPYMEEAVKL